MFHRGGPRRLIMVSVFVAVGLVICAVAQAYVQYTPQCVLRADLPTRAGPGSTDYYVSGTNDCDFYGTTTQAELEIQVCSFVHNANGNWYLVDGSCVDGNGDTDSECFECGKLYRQVKEIGVAGHEYRTWDWGWDKDNFGNISDVEYNSSGWTD